LNGTIPGTSQHAKACRAQQSFQSALLRDAPAERNVLKYFSERVFSFFFCVKDRQAALNITCHTLTEGIAL
jgi:hypothetical protein